MHRGSAAVVLLVAIIATACSSGSAAPDEAGSCAIHPGVDCHGQDLRNVSMVSADLAGANFTGADLRDSDLRYADLTGAKLVGALLGGVDFTGASLKNADLTKSNMFFTNLTDADLTGAIETDVYSCNVTQPNGGLQSGACPVSGSGFLPVAEGKAPTGPPVIESLRLEPPGRCLNDAAGEGIEVKYATGNTTSVTFAIDGIRIDGATKRRGVKRLPFECDGKPHTVTMQAFGTILPTATMSFTIALDLTAPVAPSGG